MSENQTNDHFFMKSPREEDTENANKWYDCSISYEKQENYSIWNATSKSRKNIDFFVSHSWACDKDKQIKKFEVLEKLCPKDKDLALWLDKACFNQKELTKVLPYLPVNIANCERFLLLLCDTYFTRLWCLWELFALVAFADNKEEILLQKIVVLPLVDDEKEDELYESLVNFDLDSAKCFDPNEQNKITKVINAVSKEDFVKCLKDIGEMLKQKKRQRLKS